MGKKTKDREMNDYSKTIEVMKMEYEEQIMRERVTAEERISEIAADLEMERTRVERGDRRMDELKLKFSKDVEDLLPKSIQHEFESTIDSLRSQVKDLHKTVRSLMSQHRQHENHVGNH